MKSINIVPLLGCVFGLAALIAGYYSVRLVWRETYREPKGRRLASRAVLLLLGFIATIPIGSINYQVAPTISIYGFPFLSAVFEKRDGRWLDFVGPLTLPAFLANAIVAIVLPFILAACYLRLRGRAG